MKKNAFIALIFPFMLGAGVYLRYHSDTHETTTLHIASKEVRTRSSTDQSYAATSSPKLPKPVSDRVAFVPEGTSTIFKTSGRYRSCGNPEEKLHYGSAKVEGTHFLRVIL